MKKMKNVLTILSLAGFTLGADSATLEWENIPAGITVTLAKAPFISAANFGFRPFFVGHILSQASNFKPNSLRIIDLPQENIGVKNIIYGSGTNTLNHNNKITGSVLIEGTAGEDINNVSTPAAIWLFGSAFMGLIGISISKTKG